MTLYDQLPEVENAPMARHTDPESSHAAAREVTASGLAESQRQVCLSILKLSPHGLTSDEIAEIAEISRHIPARRLSELERRGLVIRGEQRASRVTGRLGVTWRAA